jgi:CBS-domain-containing membrane protein
LLVRKKQRIIPIVDENKKILGIVSLSDVTKILMKSPSSYSKNFNSPLPNYSKELTKIEKQLYEIIEMAGSLADELSPNFLIFIFCFIFCFIFRS